MYTSPSNLPEKARKELIASLNQRLGDSLDLYSQIKVAHWNIKGPLFASLHPLFDSYATMMIDYVDEIAERLVTFGGLAAGSVRQSAAASRLPEYPAEATRDLDHARLVAERIEKWLEGMRETRKLADEREDADTADMITPMTTTFEKHAWFLRATLER
jgi:starvation-inducible DNA-binding protein